MSKTLNRKHLIDLIRFYASAYCCEVVAFSIMGTHYHLVLKFEKERKMGFSELKDRALVLYPDSEEIIDQWAEEKCEQFRQRLFNLLDFMRNLQSAYATWFNRSYKRKGRFWADRYKSVYLANRQAVMDCILYVELNPIRAGLVKRPEEWKGSSIYLRDMKENKWLMPLTAFYDNKGPKQALIDYRSRLYHRGNVPTKKGQAALSDKILREEAERGFASSGIYLKRLRYFVDGIALGSESLSF